MKNYLQASFSSLGVVPILFGISISVCYLLGVSYVFRGLWIYHDPLFASFLIVSGLIWTLFYRNKIK